ncbi:hypothetical protein GQ55_7G118700 [Panicum hallii var. hallii]|uniref:Uncharacterized protein n=1 Tax=Panicum hallii var. hallii TaxID=1504633 RepID=A0A2T7CU97_9POAL|nr:hypothetical protein GQ55_7G118700 [Panicum hallii var. hallii]
MGTTNGSGSGVFARWDDGWRRWRVRAMGRWTAAAPCYVRAASTGSRTTRHPLPPRDTQGDGAEAAPREGSAASMARWGSRVDGLRWRCSCVGTTRLHGGNARQGNRQPRRESGGGGSAAGWGPRIGRGGGGSAAAAGVGTGRSRIRGGGTTARVAAGR